MRKNEQEIWKDVVGYEGLYQVSNKGNIKSNEREFLRKNGKIKCKSKIKKQCETSKRNEQQGYLCSRLVDKDGNSRAELVHRLVATAFIPNPNNYPVVNHIDNNKHNNCADNLEWCSFSENNRQAYQTNIKKPWTKKHRYNKRYFEKVTSAIGNGIPMPKRSTSKSCAYDFYAPYDFEIKPHEMLNVKTGIKVHMLDGDFLLLTVRSSMGRKGIMMSNTIGIIDSDYYNNSTNEGEIGLMYYNFGEETWKVKKCDRIAQAIFMNYLLTDDDNADGERNGGFGSTGN